jgi:hypothetical protein
MNDQPVNIVIENIRPRRPHAAMVGWIAAAVALPWVLGAPSTSAATYECRTTPNGIPRKVIIKNRDAVAYDNSDFTVKSDKGDLQFFRKYFIFDETQQGYLVGEGTVNSSIIGWARRDDALAWNTEQAVFLINKSNGRQPVKIWQSKDDIGQVGKPCFEESLEKEHTTEPFPILEKDGDAVKVAFLWESKKPLPALEGRLEEESTDHLEGAGVDRAAEHELAVPGGSVKATGLRKITDGKGKIGQIAQEVRRMDLVLVMDVTGSMGPYMDQVKERLSEIVQALVKIKVAEQEAEVYVGVVAYRDYVDEKTTFLTKMLNLTSSMAEVNDFLDALSPDGGGGKHEAVDEALTQACERMNWGEHSFRVMCLVGDAPPHEADDPDVRYLRKGKVFVSSEFFGRPFEDNLRRSREVLNTTRVQLFMMGVGQDAETMATYPRYVDDPKRFLSLDNAQNFIAALEAELRKTRGEHDAAVAHVRAASDPTKKLSDLGDEVFQTLKVLNIDAESLQGMRGELIQTGWFRPTMGEDAAVCVYMRRADIEQWVESLRHQLLAYKEKEEDVLQGIAGRHLGPIDVRGIGDVLRAFSDAAYAPEVLQLQNLGVEDEVKIRKLRAKITNLEIMLLMNNLFSKYEEGWVPMEYLPGSLADLRKAVSPTSASP